MVILLYHHIMINILRISFTTISKMHMINVFYATVLEDHSNEKIPLKHHKKFLL